MKVFLALSLFVLGSFGSVCAQQLQRVTLYSAFYHDGRSAFNFETGERGAVVDVKTHRPVHDISFDQVHLYPPGGDLFMVADSKSMIVDLGKKTWDQFAETPSFPKSKTKVRPRPLDEEKWELDGGRNIVTPYMQFVQVKAGHVYLMRLNKSGKIIHVMFRVESVKKDDNCVLSWKQVPPPKVDMEK